MRQRILSPHKCPCHRCMVITTLSSMFCLAALQRRKRGFLARCHGIVFPFAAGGARWTITH